MQIGKCEYVLFERGEDGIKICWSEAWFLQRLIEMQGSLCLWIDAPSWNSLIRVTGHYSYDADEAACLAGELRRTFPDIPRRTIRTGGWNGDAKLNPFIYWAGRRHRLERFAKFFEHGPMSVVVFGPSHVDRNGDENGSDYDQYIF